MKLLTTITPRKDGTVIVRNAQGKAFEFKRNEHGELTGDVDDPALVATLLKSEDFVPLDTADFTAAAALVGVSGSHDETDLDTALDGVGHTPEGSPPGEGQDEPDDEGDVDAAPVEGAAAESTEVVAAVAKPAAPSRRRS